jgi:hypothetical protein
MLPVIPEKKVTPKAQDNSTETDGVFPHRAGPRYHTVKMTQGTRRLEKRRAKRKFGSRYLLVHRRYSTVLARRYAKKPSLRCVNTDSLVPQMGLRKEYPVRS